MTKRVLLAGLFHETHMFLEGTTELDDFSIRHGDELLDARGDGSPLAGALEVAAECGWELLPTVDMRCVPSATVEDAVVEYFWKQVQQAVQRELPHGIDGIYLVLHGAMAAETILDVEGEVIQRIRRLPGAETIPICGVLDLHGNISRRTFELTQGLVAYRNNPHTDACQAAINGAKLLDRILTRGVVPISLWEHPPIIWPPTGTGTADDPMKILEAMARQIEQEHEKIAVVNVFGGFSFADTPDTGVSFSAVTFGNPEIAREKLAELSRWAVENRELGNVIDQPLEAVISEIQDRISKSEQPIVIVEPSDNIGGGAPGDGTSILRAFLRHGIENSAVVIDDPAAVETLQSHVVGDLVPLSVGGHFSPLTEGPVEIEVELLSKSDGNFELEDHNSHLASMNGIHIRMGLCATVRHNLKGHNLAEHKGVNILLTSKKTPPFDLGQLRSQGIVPEDQSVIGVKAAVAHRRAYEKIQAASYTVDTPGTCSSDVKSFPFKNVRRPIFPLDEI